MAVPVVAFFSNRGGVGTTALAYHMTWMLADMGYKALAGDLDPQANLTAAMLSEERREAIWGDDGAAAGSGGTIFECVKGLREGGDWQPPAIQRVGGQFDRFGGGIGLIPGDLALAEFEDTLAAAWRKATGTGAAARRALRILAAFATAMQAGARQMGAAIILVDVGPNLGAINRSALIASDYVIVPLGSDLLALQGLRKLGPALRQWREGWRRRWEGWANPDFTLPAGGMQPIGYAAQQPGLRMGRPVRVADRWVNRMPEEYARQLLGKAEGPYAATPGEDGENALATLRHYRSLAPMAEEKGKPIFKLTVADGAVGSQAAAVVDARADFKALAEKVIQRIGLAAPDAG